MTIAGFGFDTTAAHDTVTFSNGVTGTVTSATSTSLTVSLTGLSSVTGGTALDANVTVDGVSSGSAVEVATVIPAVTSSTANLASTATSMTIAGYGFDTTAAHDTVSLSNGVTGSVTAATSTSLTLSLTGLSTVSTGTALDASVTVDGASNGSAVQVATVVTPVLAVTAVSPTQGPTAGGTTVVITGSDFTSATAVDFGTTAATTFSVNGAGTQITATDAAGTGTVNVTVTIPASHGSQTSPTSSADDFTYVTPPMANGQSLSTNENTALSGTLTASEFDSNPLTYAIAGSPAHGSLTSFNASTGTFTYTPTTGYYGADSFTFTASDDISTSTAATVTIGVVDNVTPVANAQSVSTNENTAASGTLTGSDADSNPLSDYTLDSPAAHGSVSVNASTGVFTYTPTTGFYGSDSFTFTVSDGTNTSSPGTVSISVVDNVTPVANGQSVSTNENTAVSGTVTGSDADSNPLSDYTLDSPAAHGSVSVNASTGVFTYTPTTGFHGSDSFTFTVSDGTNTSAAATVSISVVDNVTPVANAQSVSTNENTAVSGTVTGSDADSNPLTYAVASSPGHGSLTSFNASTGIFTYTPTTGFYGSDSFTFTATDGTNTSSAATVSISVVDNVTPTATGQSVSTNENTAVSGTVTGSDADSNPLTATPSAAVRRTAA